MEARAVICCLVLLFFCLCFAEEVKVTVKGATSIAETDEAFICATLDWGESGVLDVDLGNKILANAIKAFRPLRIRIGGSLQDQVVYKVGKSALKKCPHFKRSKNGLFGFSKGCLPMDRWDLMNKLFNETGAKITFGLNALAGRKTSKDDDALMVGEWDTKNTLDFMKYTASKGYKIDSYELGNELCGSGVSRRIEAEQYGRDIIVLKKLVQELYPDPATQPKVLGPAGFYDKKWFDVFLLTSGAHVVDGLTHHIYNLGAGVDPTIINKVQDPYFLDQIAQTYKDISGSIKSYGPWSRAWVGESGGAYNGGNKNVSHSFADGFWFLDQLGMTSKFNHEVFCRQTLIGGGNYGLLNTSTFIPNPDYYGALLWHRLMGKNVLHASHNGTPYLRVYSHCSKKTTGISVLVINMSNSTTFEVLVADDTISYHPEADQREEYHLTPKNGNILSDVLLLNGKALELTEGYDIPAMNPRLVDAALPLQVAPHSIIFATLKGFKAPACALYWKRENCICASSLLNEDGRSLLHVAVSSSKTEVVEILSAACRSAVNSCDEEGWGPLHSAASSVNITIVEILLNSGLHYAASKGHLKVAEILVSQGAKLNVKDKVGCTPLHRAASTGNSGVCEFLIEEGARVEEVDRAGKTPLMIAVECDNKEVALLLIRHGADVDAGDKEGYTVLGRASEDLRPSLIDAAKAMLED